MPMDRLTAVDTEVTPPNAEKSLYFNGFDSSDRDKLKKPYRDGLIANPIEKLAVLLSPLSPTLK